MFLESMMKESARAAILTTPDLPDWHRYQVGMTINARVTVTKDYGIVLLAEDGNTTLVAPSPHHVMECKTGDEVKVRVLDVDWARKVSHVNGHANGLLQKDCLSGFLGF